jgi:BirA family transcriptional regulator, biotin operon repressor / biotin---[acetyl-CoA-carboxylase] ligase
MQHPVKYFYKRLNSTNLRVSQMLPKIQVKEPFWIRTDNQVAGRGQGNKSWFSQPGLNLTGTLAIFPFRFNALNQFLLSETFALAAAGFLELFIEDVHIKWPNDLYAGDRKIGGILIETSIIGSYIDSAVMGIGLNINQLDFPGNLPNPTSVSILTGIKYDLTVLEDLLLESFINLYRLIESGDFDEIDKLYISNLYRFGELCQFKDSNQIFSARIVGINEYGHLVLQNSSGSVISFAYQEIEFVFSS